MKQETGFSTTKSSLSPQRRQLVEIMQGLNFGHIEGLHIRDGEPVLDPLPRIIREVKFGGENGPHPKASVEDFLLKSQVCEFFAQLDEMGDGTVISLEVKHGLPFKMTVEEDAA